MPLAMYGGNGSRQQCKVQTTALAAAGEQSITITRIRNTVTGLLILSHLVNLDNIDCGEEKIKTGCKKHWKSHGNLEFVDVF